MTTTKEFFNQQNPGDALKWDNEPKSWRMDDRRLTVFSESKTDFWQRTHYGFRADNGHFYYARIQGDFVLEARMNCAFKHQYDQAGLMVKVSEDCWVKTSVEYEPDEPSKLGAVVTNHGYSDWSTQDVPDELNDYLLRISRKGSDYKVEFFDESAQGWIQIRLFHLFDQPEVKAGIYCCSPKQGGFTAQFSELKITGNTRD